jgi:hypothetical protein
MPENNRSDESSERDWREYAHLKAENWPEAIPNSGPRREYGVYPWTAPTHDQYGIDDYPYIHPDAASISHYHMGDVCPMCGVPLNGQETVVTKTGKKGELLDVSPSAKPEPSYHPSCYDERTQELRQQKTNLEQET